MLLFLSDPVVPLNVRKNTILLNTIKTIKLKLLTLPPRGRWQRPKALTEEGKRTCPMAD